MAVFRRTETECWLDVRGGTSSLPIFVNPFYELACPAIGIRDTWCRTRRQFSPSDCTDFEAVGGTGWMMDRQREIGRIRSIPSLIKRTAGIRFCYLVDRTNVEPITSPKPRPIKNPPIYANDRPFIGRRPKWNPSEKRETGEEGISCNTERKDIRIRFSGRKKRDEATRIPEADRPSSGMGPLRAN